MFCSEVFEHELTSSLHVRFPSKLHADRQGVGFPPGFLPPTATRDRNRRGWPSRENDPIQTAGGGRRRHAGRPGFCRSPRWDPPSRTPSALHTTPSHSSSFKSQLLLLNPPTPAWSQVSAPFFCAKPQLFAVFMKLFNRQVWANHKDSH